MNHHSTTLWSPILSGPDDDFSNFLDFNDFQLNFPAFGSGTHDGGEMQQEPPEAPDTNMANEIDVVAFKEADLEQQIDPSLMPQTTMTGINDMPGSTESLMELNMHSHLFNQPQDENKQERQDIDQYRRQGMVPPTPNSVEMKGSHARYHSQIDPYAQAMYENYSRKQQDVSIDI